MERWVDLKEEDIISIMCVHIYYLCVGAIPRDGFIEGIKTLHARAHTHTHNI
jgi:hypothetical protein